MVARVVDDPRHRQRHQHRRARPRAAARTGDVVAHAAVDVHAGAGRGRRPAARPPTASSTPAPSSWTDSHRRSRPLASAAPSWRARRAGCYRLLARRPSASAAAARQVAAVGVGAGVVGAAGHVEDPAASASPSPGGDAGHAPLGGFDPRRARRRPHRRRLRAGTGTVAAPSAVRVAGRVESCADDRVAGTGQERRVARRRRTIVCTRSILARALGELRQSS